MQRTLSAQGVVVTVLCLLSSPAHSQASGLTYS
jgi:hypothetical protein